MLKEMLVVLGLLVAAAAFRSCRRNCCRKLGAIIFLIATFFALYFLTNQIWAGLLGVVAWFFLPWIELLTRVRKLRFPIENQLDHRDPPEDEFFPNASRALIAMNEAGFEHVEDAAWNSSGMEQYLRLHWNPEHRATAAVNLCEQRNVAFAFITISSRDEKGRIFRTTNFPFSPTLMNAPELRWNHVPCERNCFHQILKDHQKFLNKRGVKESHLCMPDPERLEAEVEEEMKHQLAHNLAKGVIEKADATHFRYSKRGLAFLWMQSVKDMVRLC